METIKNLIAKPAPWLYFVLVVALLIIVTNNSGTINDLEAELDNANAEISASETLTESLSDELAIRNDAIAGLENVILSRTGYTGEDGFEIYVPSWEGPRLWGEILLATVVIPKCNLLKLRN